MAVLGVGCASTGHARYDGETDTNIGTGSAAMTEVGYASDDDRAAAQSTVSALGRSVETRAAWVNKFPFYNHNLRTMETYTFAVPDSSIAMAADNKTAPEFTADLAPGTVYVEAAGGSGEVRTGRVIRHSPNPTR